MLKDLEFVNRILSKNILIYAITKTFWYFQPSMHFFWKLSQKIRVKKFLKMALFAIKTMMAKNPYIANIYKLIVF